MIACLFANAHRDAKAHPAPFKPADFFPSLDSRLRGNDRKRRAKRQRKMNPAAMRAAFIDGAKAMGIPVVESEKPEFRSQKSEARSQKAEDRSQKAEDRSQKTEDRS